MAATLVAFIVLALTPSLYQEPAAPAATYTVSGRVVDGTTGRSVNGAFVVIWERLKERSSGRRLSTSNGNFEIPNVPPGLYTMTVEVPNAGFSFRTETVGIEVRNGNVAGLGLVITPFGPRPRAMTGKIVMENGAPLATSINRIRVGAESATVQRDGSFQLQLRAEEKYPVRVDELPEGAYVRDVSGGAWDSSAETLVFSSTPASTTMQVTLAIGTRTLRGRVLDKTRTPVDSQTILTLSIPSSPSPVRRVPVNADGTFQVAQLRATNYELKARLGSGAMTQFLSVPVSLANSDRRDVEMVLKEMTPQKGRVVIEGAGRMEELLHFRPVIEVTDVLGLHQLPIHADGTFEFQSFEGEYAVQIRNVPVGYDKSITVTGSAVEVKLRVVQGDFEGGPRLPRQR